MEDVIQFLFDFSILLGLIVPTSRCGQVEIDISIDRDSL